MDDERIDVFFYGLFMDEEVLAAHRIRVRNSRRAFADGYALRIGERASLVPAAGARAYGMVHALTRTELDRLYAQPGLEAYRPEPIVVRSPDGARIPAMCYVLATAPRPVEASPEYAARLREVLSRLGFPQEYVDSVTGSDASCEGG